MGLGGESSKMGLWERERPRDSMLVSNGSVLVVQQISGHTCRQGSKFKNATNFAAKKNCVE